VRAGRLVGSGVRRVGGPRRVRGPLQCLLLGLLLLAGCAGGGSPTPSPSPTDAPGPGGAARPVRVTLGIYSGRPDPSWILADAEAAALEAALAALPRAVGTPPVGGLGYHGFTIDRPGGPVVAYRGAVAPPGEGERALLADPARTIERLLVETARPHVTGNELTEVERSLAAP
jgi:hypothetical protein